MSSEMDVSSTPTNRMSYMSHRVSGVVKWFNVKHGYGYIKRDDNGEDVFVHYRSICRPSPWKVTASLADGEKVEFILVESDKGLEATAITGPQGVHVKGSAYTAFKKDMRTSRKDNRISNVNRHRNEAESNHQNYSRIKRYFSREFSRKFKGRLN